MSILSRFAESWSFKSLVSKTVILESMAGDFIVAGVSALKSFINVLKIASSSLKKEKFAFLSKSIFVERSWYFCQVLTAFCESALSKYSTYLIFSISSLVIFCSSLVVSIMVVSTALGSWLQLETKKKKKTQVKKKN